ncbi:MAG: hypothetical protein ABS81_09570 [Pseudonocardia sp. SCN 72-86]|nr:MAG: hypothetical protein ABS81_09570 [Pseudonocardia sp. SCN 72-86]
MLDVAPSLEDLIGSADLAVAPEAAYRRLLEEGRPAWVTVDGTKVFSAHRTCQMILRKPDVFGQIAAQHKKPSFFGLNRPEHTRIRSLVAQAFTVPAIRRLQADIEETAAGIMSRLGPRGHMDMVTELARPLAATMITKMIGIPPSDQPLWEGWADTIHHAIGSTVGILPDQQRLKGELMAGARDASEQEAEYFRALIERRRGEPRQDDLLALMMEAEEEGSRLTDEELRYTLVLVLGAGHHTTVNLMVLTTMSLLRNPDQLALVRADRSLLPNAIDETARHEGVLQFTQRIARADTEIDGVQVREGEVVHLALAAANHDPDVFDDPWAFDIRRENLSRHLGFGHGIHHCLGRILGMAEAGVALNALLDLPDLRLGAFEFEGMPGLRGPFSLPLEWTPTDAHA